MALSFRAGTFGEIITSRFHLPWVMGLAVVVAGAAPATAAVAVVSTVAGDGTAGFSGDGGSATAASLNNPTQVAVDAAGNRYIADDSNFRVRKVTPAGVITTIAGTGTFGYSGDGGSATAAELGTPSTLVLDAQGDLYINDIDDCVVRRIDTHGVITTVAGSGTLGYGGDGGPATAAAVKLDGPQGIALDRAGNLYIADNENFRIRKVSGGIITTIIGTGIEATPGDTGAQDGDGGAGISARLFSANGVAVDALGDVYVVDFGFDVVRMVGTGGIITTVAGTYGVSGFSGDGGAATAAKFNGLSSVTVDDTGNLLLCDGYNSRVREVTAVVPQPPTITSAASVTATIDASFTYQITASGSPTSFGASGLPVGLTVNTANGLISGNATSAGTTDVTVTATNTVGTGSATVAITVTSALPPPQITNAATASTTVGTAVTFQITATNAPTSYGATNLPPGLNLNTVTGQVTGTPTTAGTFSVTLSATNASGTGTATVVVTINASGGTATAGGTSTAGGTATAGGTTTAAAGGGGGGGGGGCGLGAGLTAMIGVAALGLVRRKRQG